MFKSRPSENNAELENKVTALEKELTSLIEYVGEHRYNQYKREHSKSFEERNKSLSSSLRDYFDIERRDLESSKGKINEYLEDRVAELRREYEEAHEKVDNVNNRINTLAATAQPPKYAKGDKLITIPDHGNPVFSGVVRQINTNDEGTDFYSYILMNKEQEQGEFLESELELDV